MLSEQEYVAEYAKSHQNPLNQVIHMICVPAIFAASLGLLWLIPVGKFIPGMPAEIAPWINMATITMLPAGVFYLSLSLKAFAVGAAWTVASMLLVFGILALEWPLLWICVAVWVIAWAVQFYGHQVEGAKPSFIEDMFFLLIGPLYVQEKLNRLVRTGSIRPQVH